MIDKNKTQELQYLMKYYHIDSIPVFYKNWYMGDVTKSLEYDTYNALHRYTEIKYAIERACEEISDIVSIIKNWNKPVEVSVEFHSPKRVQVTSKDGFIYEAERDTVKEEVFEGTFDKVCEQLEKANNTFRYCNGTYYEFKDEKMRNDYRYWRHLIPFSRSFDLYYPGNTVVD